MQPRPAATLYNTEFFSDTDIEFMSLVLAGKQTFAYKHDPCKFCLHEVVGIETGYSAWASTAIIIPLCQRDCKVRVLATPSVQCETWRGGFEGSRERPCDAVVSISNVVPVWDGCESHMIGVCEIQKRSEKKATTTRLELTLPESSPPSSHPP